MYKSTCRATDGQSTPRNAARADTGDGVTATIALGTLTSSSGTGLGGGAKQHATARSVTYTLKDAVTPSATTVKFSAATYSVTEGQNAQPELVLSQAVSQAVTVTVTDLPVVPPARAWTTRAVPTP